MSKLYLNTNDLEKVKVMQDTNYYSDKRYVDGEDGRLVSLLNPLINFVQVSEMPISDTINGQLDVGNSGVIFENAKGLPEGFVESIKYWNERVEPKAPDPGAVYYQNPSHEYMVSLKEVKNTEGYDTEAPVDEILTEGYVVKFDLTRANLEADHVVELQIRINLEFFCNDESGMDLKQEDAQLHIVESDTLITVYVKTADVLAAPSRIIWLDLIGYSMLDYGYYY